MYRIIFAAILGVTLIVGGSTGQPPKQKDPPKKDAPKDKAPPKEKDKPVVKDVAGMFKTKDLAKKTLTLTVDGKERVFMITDETKIVGPRGNERELKDDVLDKGYKITVTPRSANSDEAAVVKLPFANEREGGGKTKDKPKDKEKSR